MTKRKFKPGDTVIGKDSANIYEFTREDVVCDVVSVSGGLIRVTVRNKPEWGWFQVDPDNFMEVK